MRRVESLLCMVVALLLALPAWALEGKVVSVSDGDTIKVLVGRQQVKVRLAEIDTPEKRQPHGSKAKQALSALVFGKRVRVVETARDRYGRTVGRVYAGSVDVNAEMVRQGHAWVYRKYAKDPELFAAERAAREARRGLWALPEQIPPWEWRRARKGKPRVVASKEAVFTCGAKRYCSEMAHCDEARFHVKQCGLARLDRDRDGVPCEALCR